MKKLQWCFVFFCPLLDTELMCQCVSGGFKHDDLLQVFTTSLTLELEATCWVEFDSYMLRVNCSEFSHYIFLR